ncbi:MAG: STAS domain-containing protein [Acidobacteria bacterium]|nr:STAS domain-containing protein [Acidobacteriota bacterium]
MEILVEQRGPVTILRPQGDLKIGDGDVALRRAVQEQIQRGSRQIVLDLSRVAFMDSSGIGEIVASFKRVRRAGGEIKLSRPNPRVRETFGVTQLVRVLEIHEDEESAIASFQGP